MKRYIAVLFLLLAIDSSWAGKNEAKEVKSIDDAVKFLTKFGYNPCDGQTSGVLCSISASSIMNYYQERFRLKVTGKFDDATKRHMNKARCGNKITPGTKLGDPHGLATTKKWSRSTLSWSIRSFPEQINADRTTSIMRQAFDVWLAHIPLTITQTCSTCPADFIIEFVRGDHKDGYPFDGFGRILAHAFSPEDGRIHFNADENWTESFNGSSKNLYLAAVHEIGHALGLQHLETDVKTIMHELYEEMSKDLQLPQVDILNIQKLYPSSSQSTASSRTTTTTQTAKTTTKIIPRPQNMTKWTHSSLTWSLRSFPKQISKDRTTSIIQQAFDVWLAHIPLTVAQTCSTCSADFIIEFVREDHNDGSPFDGAGAVLAHAFLPEDGRIHFDADEDWTESFNSDTDKKNLYLVAAHQIGTALGLGSSFDQTSLMYVVYNPMQKADVLPRVDRDNVQRLYGSASKPAVSSRTTTTQTAKTTTKIILESLNAGKWTRSSLTWSLRSFPKQISKDRTTSIIQQAFDIWLAHIPLNITQTCSTCSADFIIEFVRGDHKDGAPFDGANGTLAHAFFPEDGRIHFDADEDWTESFDSDKKNLYVVAVHNIGHALGLQHLHDEASVMYFFYNPIQKKDLLSQVDRYNIQRLYGSSSKQTVPSRTTPSQSTIRARKPKKSHARCQVFIDAAFDYPDGTFHTLDAGKLWRYRPNNRSWENEATSYKNTYPHLLKIVAGGIYHTITRQVLIFTNTDVHRYQIDRYSNAARYVRTDPLAPHLRNSIVGAIYYLDHVYIVKKTTLELFDLDSPTKSPTARALKEEFPHFSGSVTTAFSHGDLHHFFTSERLVYVWDTRLDAWQTFAKPMETSWFACSANKMS